MKRIGIILALLAAGLLGRPAQAQLLSGLLSGVTQTLTNTVNTVLAPPHGVIVRTTLGGDGLAQVCLLNGCTVQASLDGGQGQLFLVQPVQGLVPQVLADLLNLVDGILDAEPDQLIVIPPNQDSAFLFAPPTNLYDSQLVNYYGAPVWNGYANQPAAYKINAPNARNWFGVTGTGIVADIDTGVDPNHPALKGILLQGYDFTRNQPGASEMNDLTNINGQPCNTCQAAFVNQHTAAMLDQHTAAMLDGSPYAAFGHGTEVAGVIHMIAPTAHVLPLKAFHADGSGDLSDILRAIYYAVQNHANVINMSFDMTTSSKELSRAIQYAAGKNVICVASAGNDGQEEVVYPAALKGVIGVASTNLFDQRSSFSNYGDQVVWVAAPGENIVTTYPFGTYSAASGTSFSSPMVAGTVDLILNLRPQATPSQAANAVAHAVWIGPNMGYGRLDVVQALSAALWTW